MALRRLFGAVCLLLLLLLLCFSIPLSLLKVEENRKENYVRNYPMQLKYYVLISVSVNVSFAMEIFSYDTVVGGGKKTKSISEATIESEDSSSSSFHLPSFY
ncbi:hypothetical protein FRACYDRAFT_257236 [Fragilariopsis cylindrus CCMP1102]|uniref:Uncharacterized protein n=1 Tax=Fragilariopsis cylindrus CCMP1102 TaxID=635003 RepID=A0A1E7EJ72_9STRA|nr:hypothetical protein FRACYDRAFT_257236 [Fragilariopsis cylindrus CCMP1102]|eukprot:OEU05949.1 hypothetical protein FRACYDRAFT_257236 [Fragilariopsis cylindrus CCMP1102]